MYFIGIDIGTTNTKLCLFKMPEFNCVYKYSFKTPIIVENQNSNFDIADIWVNIKKGLKVISSKVEDREQIKNISIASVGEAGVLVNESGKTLGPAITWYDKRTKEQLEYIHSKISREEIYKITGLPSHTNYSINKILWIMDNFNESIEDDYKWLCMADYFGYKLTGNMYTEFSLASRTMALDLTKRNWSKELLDTLKVNSSLFPDISVSGNEIGHITKEAADETGLSMSTSVSIAGHDHMCGSIAAGITSEDTVLNSTGTTEGILILQKNPNLNFDFYNTAVSNGVDVLDNYYTLFASLPAAGYSVEWFIKNFFKAGTTFDEVMEELALQCSKESKLIYVPHLRGSGPPNRSIFSKGLFYGLTESSTKYDLLRAVFEGLCFELRNLLESVEGLTHKNYSTIRVIGSACRNPYWLQLKADILNKTVIACEIDEAVAKGAAMLSAYRMGLLGNIDSLDLACDTKVFTPNSKKVYKYTEVFEKLYMPLYKNKINFEMNNWREE